MIRQTLIAVVFFVASLIGNVNGYAVAPGAIFSGSSFVVSQRHVAVNTNSHNRSAKNTISMMGGKKAKFGVFSVAVYGAKIVLGDKKLNALRGKGISLHSQAIGEFCTWAGAYHLRTRLIKKAKTNGDILGFLV